MTSDFDGYHARIQPPPGAAMDATGMPRPKLIAIYPDYRYHRDGTRKQTGWSVDEDYALEYPEAQRFVPADLHAAVVQERDELTTRMANLFEDARDLKRERDALAERLARVEAALTEVHNIAFPLNPPFRESAQMVAIARAALAPAPSGEATP